MFVGFRSLKCPGLMFHPYALPPFSTATSPLFPEGPQNGRVPQSKRRGSYRSGWGWSIQERGRVPEEVKGRRGERGPT